jgi:hypothetical protein
LDVRVIPNLTAEAQRSAETRRGLNLQDAKNAKAYAFALFEASRLSFIYVAQYRFYLAIAENSLLCVLSALRR